MFNTLQQAHLDSLKASHFSNCYTVACTEVIKYLFEEIQELKQDMAAIRYKGHE